MGEQPSTFKKPSQEEIGQLFGDLLNRNIIPQTHTHLFNSLGAIFELYEMSYVDSPSIKSAKEYLKMIEDVIEALDKVALFIIHGIDIVPGFFGTMRVSSEPPKTSKKKRISDIMGDLRKERERAEKIIQEYNITSLSPQIWLTINLYKQVKESFSSSEIRENQILSAVYKLLCFVGIEDGKSKDPPEMIRKRVERHLVPYISFQFERNDL